MRVSLGLGTTAFMILAMVSVTPAADDVDVSGKWSGTWTRNRSSGPCIFEIVQKERGLTGEVTLAGREPARPSSYTVPLKGSVKGDTVEFSWMPPGLGVSAFKVFFEGKVSENTLTGTTDSGRGAVGTYTVTRGQ